MRLEQATVLLTGAGGGIGSIVAERLCAGGARLLLTDLRADALELTAVRCGRHGPLPEFVIANVTQDEDRAALVERADAVGVNALINIAGINPFGLYAEQSEAEIRRSIEINTIAPMLLCRAMLPLLCRRSSARIVNVGSTFGSIGFPGFTAYSASKFAIHGFSEALRRELADSPVSVHYLAPRATRTALSTERVTAMNDALNVATDPPDHVAAAVVRMLERNEKERFLGWPERLFARLNGLWPALVDRSLAKQLPVIRRYAGRDFRSAPESDAPLGLEI